jgi:phage gp46-like protein
MSDIATSWDIGTGTGDWILSAASASFWTDEDGNSIVDGSGQPVDFFFTAGEGLEAGGDLMTALFISLFTDAVAAPDDIIPDGSGDPRGWWGGPIGSKLWLRSRMKALPVVPALVKNDIEQALAWLVDDGVVAKVDVTTEWTRPGMLGGQIVLLRADGAHAALNFSRLWENL